MTATVAISLPTIPEEVSSDFLPLPRPPTPPRCRPRRGMDCSSHHRQGVGKKRKTKDAIIGTVVVPTMNECQIESLACEELDADPWEEDSSHQVEHRGARPSSPTTWRKEEAVVESLDDELPSSPEDQHPVEIDMPHIVRLSLWSSLPIVVLDGMVRVIHRFEETTHGAGDDDSGAGHDEVGAHKVDFLSLGGPLAVLHAMRRHIESVDIQVAGCNVFTALLGDHNVSLYWLTYLGCGLGAIRHLVMMLRAWFESGPLQEAGYHLLLRLTCTSPGNTKEFCSMGGISTILMRVSQFPKSSKTFADVSSLLKILCAWEETRTMLIETRTVTYSPPSSPQDAAESSSSSMHSSVTLATAVSTLASATSPKLEHPIDSLSDHSSGGSSLSDDVMILNFGPALRKRTKSRAYRRCFSVELRSEDDTARSARDVDLLRHPLSTSLLKAISEDLWQVDEYAMELALEQVRVVTRLHANQGLHTLLLGIGPLALIKLLERKSFTDAESCTTVHQLTCHLIHTLTEELEGFHLMFLDLNVVEVLASSLRRVSHHSNHKLMKPGFDALRELVKRSNSAPDLMDQVVRSGAMELLVQHMLNHPRKSSVQVSSCKLLQLFAKTHQRPLVKAGVMGALMAVFENHMDNRKALSAAKSIIQSFV